MPQAPIRSRRSRPCPSMSSRLARAGRHSRWHGRPPPPSTRWTSRSPTSRFRPQRPPPSVLQARPTSCQLTPHRRCQRRSPRRLPRRGPHRQRLERRPFQKPRTSRARNHQTLHQPRAHRCRRTSKQHLAHRSHGRPPPSRLPRLDRWQCLDGVNATNAPTMRSPKLQSPRRRCLLRVRQPPTCPRRWQRSPMPLWPRQPSASPSVCRRRQRPRRPSSCHRRFAQPLTPHPQPGWTRRRPRHPIRRPPSWIKS